LAAERSEVGRLPAGFYARPVVEVAKDLIGCVVEHDATSGVIVETEAYHESEPACHAFIGLTPRTRILFGPPGRAYVYRSYGIHAMLNAVCEQEGTGAAVLIRALQPLEGIATMRDRRWPVAGRSIDGEGHSARRNGMRDRDLCSGPGKLTQALGIELSENGGDLYDGPVRILPRGAAWRDPHVVEGTRIGITKAVELRWCFCLAGNPHVSRPRPAEGLLAPGSASD
jgi:DNA-3-methyladenine glycosylase